ncbi:hypothetical protein JOD31_002338 [Methylopila capsulata]|uniref:PepSY domain-containing protein n=1 Tax=Methylopila capsulata TaxID=61654 RepID=A0A9W6IVC6_9HYPH|nr:hypothetical protein [Methylopila capsulata]MBM7852096.1 hypothetical protein [Methylopila capsulata]GLK56302.1 hypothetical protein GCM10008170_23210 [Methylopila capsulata]
MTSFRVAQAVLLALAVCLGAAPAAADDQPRAGSVPGTILVPAPQADEQLKIVPPRPPGQENDGPPPGLYKRVTPLREGETPPQTEYLQIAPARRPAPPPEDRPRRERDDDGARKAARGECLSAREARGAIGSKRAVTLAQAARAAREAWDGEVIDYKLCDVGGLLTYDLTLLNADGKVARARVDAGTGKLVNVR